MVKNILIALVVAGIGAFSYWTISPLFIDTVVEDELDPEINALLEQNTGAEPASEESAAEPNDEVRADPTTSEPLPLPEVGEQPNAAASGLADETSIPAEGTVPSTIVEGPFTINDTPTHPATGNVRLIRTPDETIVRYENYDGTNGPDLKVYLTNDLEDASDFVSLGDARGNQGNINYSVPSDIDIDEYRYVVTWCEAFGVLFDYAEVN